jgi:hypothetical protein
MAGERMNNDIEKEIREQWFKNHVATLTQHGNLQVLDWREPKRFKYACRYVFDNEFVYISGDIGEAVFRLTWNANVHSFNLSPHYFHEKLSAYKDDNWDFSSDAALKRLREWLKELKNCRIKYDHDEMAELFSQARDCGSNNEWAFIINGHYDFISKLDCDFFEWMYSCGYVIPARVYGYLIGLQMASEQLKASAAHA